MTLTLKITREVEPNEITSMIYGTGVLSTFWWWLDAAWLRGGKRLDVRGHVIPLVQEGDVFDFESVDPDDLRTFTRRLVTMDALVSAASHAIGKGYVHGTDAIHESLGYCDAREADSVLQIAVFGGLVYG